MRPDYGLIPKPDRSTEARAVSEKTKREVIASQGGICKRANCDAPATDVDHIIPLWATGSNKRSNLEGLCHPHHQQKTSAEAKARGKVRRIEKAELGIRKNKKPILSRGFGDVSRKFDGTIGPVKNRRNRD